MPLVILGLSKGIMFASFFLATFFYWAIYEDMKYKFMEEKLREEAIKYAGFFTILGVGIWMILKDWST